ncbi:MAG: hypothetical protein GXP25_15535 [Planctomycetes bacterium]|nr:hypothetical protein [Planctomycetota bacterium]
MKGLRSIQTRIEQETGRSFVDMIRTRYWASFATIDTLAEDLGCTRDQLLNLMQRHPWEFQKPPALRYQNEETPTPPISEAVSVADFVRSEQGQSSRLGTKAIIEPAEEEVRITFECRESNMDSLRQSAGTTEKERDPFNIGVWEAHFGEWENEWQWWTVHLRQAGSAGARDDLVKRARAVGPRPYSVFEDDCVIVALAPVHIGEDTNPLDVTRFDPDPWALARELKRPEDSRIYQTGTYYLLAVNPRGVAQETYYDPWEDGFFWPSWRSGAKVQAEQLADAWRVSLTIPFRNLEPLMDNGAVWGVDIFRHKPAANTDEGEYARSRDTVFFRYEGESIALKYWNVTFEDTARHAWVPAAVPHVLETIERPVPETTAAFLEPDVPEEGWPADSDWAKAERIDQFFDDRTGQPARAKTDAQLLFDRKHLYVRFQCYEDHIDQLQVVDREEEESEYPGHLRANFLYRRCEFGIGWGDFVEIMLAPGVNGADRYHGGFYNLLVNSRGTLLESRHDPFGMISLREEDEWHSGSRVSVVVQEDRWIVQIAIPFGSLYGIRSADAAWHLNLQRTRAAKPDDNWREQSAWAPSYGWPRNREYAGKRNPERLGKLHLAGADFANWVTGRSTPGFFMGRPDDVVIESLTRDRTRDPLRGICLVDEQCGWAVGGFGTVLHTRDGGAGWDEQSSGTGYALESTAFVGRERGWIVGGWLRDKTVATIGGMGIILATSDGGRRWRAQWEGKGPWLYDVSFVDEHVGWASGENGTVLKTENGGETWMHLPTTGTMSPLHGICFVDRQRGWAVGGNETIIVTRDGGKSWTRAQCPALPRPLGRRKTLRAVSAVDPRHCWVVGAEGTILRTTDGGETWELQNLGIDPKAAHVFDLTDVCFTDARYGWIAGEIGSAIFRTENGGRTWEAVRTGIGHALSSVQFVNGRTGWAVGERGTRLKTSDGGRSWRAEAVAPERPGIMYVTAHDHHMNNVAGPLAALATDHEITCVFAMGVPDVCRAAAWSIGAWQARPFRRYIGGRRRAPGRLHHHYQTKRGLDPMERHLAATIRALKPEAVLCEWPIMDEGYWAGEPAFTARAVVRAFESAGDANKFRELGDLGLAPWQASRLYHVGSFFNDLYRVHPTNVTLKPEDNYSDTLGMPASEAKFRHSCCWRGLLDRHSGHQAVGSLALHLKREV